MVTAIKAIFLAVREDAIPTILLSKNINIRLWAGKPQKDSHPGITRVNHSRES